MRLNVGGTRALRWLYRPVVGVFDFRLSNAEGGFDMYKEDIGPPSLGFPGEPRNGLWNGIGWSTPEKDALTAP